MSIQKILIVVDPLYDFLNKNGALYIGNDEKTKNLITEMKKYIDEAWKNITENPASQFILYLCDSHDIDDLEFKRFPVHAVKGSKGSEIIPELLVVNNLFTNKIEKQRYSGFYNTDLNMYFPKSDYYKTHTEVTVIGVCTHICVMDTVGELSNRDYNINIPTQAIGDFDPEMENFAIKRMKNLYGVNFI